MSQHASTLHDIRNLKKKFHPKDALYITLARAHNTMIQNLSDYKMCIPMDVIPSIEELLQHATIEEMCFTMEEIIKSINQNDVNLTAEHGLGKCLFLIGETKKTLCCKPFNTHQKYIIIPDNYFSLVDVLKKLK